MQALLLEYSRNIPPNRKAILSVLGRDHDGRELEELLAVYTRPNVLTPLFDGPKVNNN